jgi:hypothetical protein
MEAVYCFTVVFLLCVGLGLRLGIGIGIGIGILAAEGALGVVRLAGLTAFWLY